MLLRELFEKQGETVGIIFGRFNPPHQGHRAAWEMAAENDHWFVGTNQSTQGPKDPLPYNVKVKAMVAVWPEVKGHIVAETSWLTLASKVYEKYGEITLNVYTDEDWVTKTLIQYNGKEGPHGLYNFSGIQQHPTPRLSSATALRAAVQAGDRKAFSQAAGVDADTPVAGHPFFDLVAHYLAPHAEKEKAKAVKKKVKEPVSEYGDTTKGQKMLTKVQKRAVDRVTSKKADTDPAYAKKNKETADRAWDRMSDKDVAEESGISKEKETKFHAKLDKLVHNTFGKRDDEMKETRRMSAAVKLQRAWEREQAKSAASRRRGEEIMAQARKHHNDHNEEEWYDRHGNADPRGAYDAGGHYHMDRDMEEMYQGHHRTLKHHLSKSHSPTKGVETSAKKSANHLIRK